MVVLMEAVVMADEWIFDGPSALDRIGELVAGVVTGVARHGVFIDIGADHIGHIDPIYIDTGDFYKVGDRVIVYLEGYSKASKEYRLRPQGKLTMAEWLRERRETEGDG